MSRVLATRRRGLGAAGGGMPFTPCSYVYNRTNTYIDTGVNITSDISVETKLYCDTNTTHTKYGTYPSLLVSYKASVSYLQVTYKGAVANAVQNAYHWKAYTFKNDKNLFYVDDTLIFTAAEGTWSSTTKLKLGVCDTNTAAVQRTYYAKVWDGDTLIRNYIPCYDSDNVGLLYDTINGTANYSQGTYAYLWG